MTHSPVNVVSLFDGCSCGRQALKLAGIPVKSYFASEIDKYAIQVSQANFPDIIRMGDVRKIVEEQVIMLPKIDLLIGGSPCQGFSFAGKQLNFDDPRSALFFEFVRVLDELRESNPDIKFLLENVKMKKEYQDIISRILGVQPIEINSALVSAQNRRRLYWTNIEGIQQPEDRFIFLKDIVHEFSVVDREKSTALTAGYQQTSPADYFEKSRGQYVGQILSEKELAYMGRKVKDGRTHFDFGHHSDTKNDKSSCVTAAFAKGVPYNVLALRGVHGTGRGKRKEGLTSSPDKSPSMTAHSWETNNHLAFTLVDEKVIRSDTHSSANGLKYFGGIDTGSNWGKDGKTLQRNFSQGNRIYKIDGKAPSLSASMGGGAAGSALIVEEIEEVLYYRKLTPIECERLQTLPDNYTAGVSKSQRYRMLGNGWTVGVIAHILSYYK